MHFAAPVLGGGGLNFIGYFIPPHNLSRDWCGSPPSSSSYNVGGGGGGGGLGKENCIQVAWVEIG